MTKAHKTNEFTHDKMIRGFHDLKGKARLCNRRNWCEVWEIPTLPPGVSAEVAPAAAAAAAAALAGGGSTSGGGAGATAPSPSPSVVGQFSPQPPSVEHLRWPMACHLDGRLHAASGDIVFALRVERFQKAPVIDGRVQEYQYVVPTLLKPQRHSVGGRMGTASQQVDFYGQTGWSRRYKPEDAPGGGSAAGKRAFHHHAASGASTATALQGVRRAPRGAAAAGVGGGASVVPAAAGEVGAATTSAV
jgi:hypothetical protein